MSERFDLNSLPYSYLKDICKNLHIRGEEAAGSLAKSYNADGTYGSVQFDYLNSPEFNAFARSGEQDHFVEVNIGCMFLLDVLLKRLFSSKHIVPEVPTKQESIERYKLPFIADIKKGKIDCGYEFELDDNRFFISYAMQDFCSTFIVMHELSHVICGHTRGCQLYFGAHEVNEFNPLLDFIYRGRYLRMAWEYDADITASVIISQYIIHFITASKGPHLEEAFAFASPAQKAGLIIASLFGMFAYMSRLKYARRLVSSHPHPLVRAQYVGDIIMYKISSKLGIPIDTIEEYKIEYIFQFCIALEEMDLFNWDKFSDKFEGTREPVLQLRSLAKRLRHFCDSWAWVPRTSWE